ncbi:hypothetical protein Tco_0539390 [Tanacetum coccineum]
MGVIMELHNGGCYWPTTWEAEVKEEDEGDDGGEAGGGRVEWISKMSSGEGSTLGWGSKMNEPTRSDYPPVGYQGYMPLGYEYRPGPSQDDPYFLELRSEQSCVSIPLLRMCMCGFVAFSGALRSILNYAVEQHRVETKTFEVKMNQALVTKSELLLEQSDDKDIVNIESLVRSKEQCAEFTVDNHGLRQIIREVFVKLLLDSFGKLSIRYFLHGVVGFDVGHIFRSGAMIVAKRMELFAIHNKAEMEDEVVIIDIFEYVSPLKCFPKELYYIYPRRRIGFCMELVQGETLICEGSCRLTSLERQEVWNDCRSCKVRVGSNGNLLWEKADLVHGDDVAKIVFRMRNGHVEVYGYAFWVNQCTSGFHGVNEPGGVRVTRKDDRGVSEGREDVREVFQQRGSRAKRKLSRCGRNQMGNEPTLALPEGADDFVVYYDARSKELEACSDKERR